MKPTSYIFSLRHHAAGLLISLSAIAGADAAAIVYYQFEGTGTASTLAGAIADSSGNSRNGTASGTGGGAVPAYSGVTVGSQIRDGVGGSIINSNNTSSLRFTNPGIASNTYANNGGGRVTLADTAATGTATPLRAANFTIEAFVKVDQQVQFASIVGKTRPGGSTWLLDTSPNVSDSGVTQPTTMSLRSRVDHQVAGTTGGAGSNQNFGNTLAASSITTTSTGLGDGWHHIAMTYIDATNTVTLFVDYVAVATGQLSTAGTNDLVYEPGDFLIGGGGGGRGFDGWIDEVRYSDTVLGTDNFLRVDIIPEPSHAMLLLTGLTAIGLRRRRLA